MRRRPPYWIKYTPQYRSNASSLVFLAFIRLIWWIRLVLLLLNSDPLLLPRHNLCVFSSAPCSRWICLCSTDGKSMGFPDRVKLAWLPGFENIPAPFALAYVHVAALLHDSVQFQNWTSPLHSQRCCVQSFYVLLCTSIQLFFFQFNVLLFHVYFHKTYF